MRWTPKHISIGMLAVAAAILAVVAMMDPVDTTPDPVGPIGSGLSVDSSSDNPATDDPPVPSTTRPVITLGDLDPPPDPCTLIGWTGVHRIDTNQQGRPMCIGLIPAGDGVAGAKPRPRVCPRRTYASWSLPPFSTSPRPFASAPRAATHPHTAYSLPTTGTGRCTNTRKRLEFTDPRLRRHTT